MVKRTRFSEAACPVARSLDEIGDWWSLLIVRDAFLGARRFGDFQRGLGVAKNILAARLRALVASGVLELAPFAPGGAYREYRLTEKGRALHMVMVALRQWGEAHCFGADPVPSQIVDRRSERPVRPLELRAQDGRLLGPDDTRIVSRGAASDALDARAPGSSGS